MTTWRGVRNELEGAWRSVQYDLARARSRRRNGDETTELIFPEHARPPRRLVATGGFALVSLAGAIGTYLAVVNGLGALLSPATATDERPASVVAGADGTGRRPVAQAARPDTTVRIARQGGPLTVAGRRPSAGGAGSWDTHDGVPGGVGPGADPALPRGGGPAPEESDDPGAGAAPTPTASPAPAPSDTAGPTPGETPSATAGPTPDDEYSAEPTDDATDGGRKRHRHHRRDQGENP